MSQKDSETYLGLLVSKLDLGPKSTKSVLITAVQPSTLQRVEGHTDSLHRAWSWSPEAQGRAP